jgi:hypothetical protein
VGKIQELKEFTALLQANPQMKNDLDPIIAIVLEDFKDLQQEDRLKRREARPPRHRTPD